MIDSNIGGRCIQDGGNEGEGSCGAILPDMLVNGDETRTDGRVRTLLIEKPSSQDEHIGFNLTRSQWDPYPWVRSVDEDSAAGRAGLMEGDCLIKAGGEDLLGLKVSEIARLLRSCGSTVTLIVWNAGQLDGWDPEALVGGPLPGALRRVGACLGAVLRAAECPVCGCTVPPPALQCPRGHLLCARCRPRLNSCPLCRAPTTHIRNLIADEIYNSVVDAFDLKENEGRRRLTSALFGEGAMFVKKPSEQEVKQRTRYFTEHDGLRGARQRLLDRLLPGRARSTGNIPRATRGGRRDRSGLAEERDVSRSLSTLDIARCGADDSPGSSLPSTAGGSCDSLSHAAFSINNRAVTPVDEGSNQTNYHCPFSSHCSERITDDLICHCVVSHGVDVTVRGSEGVELRPRGPSLALVTAPGNLYFYPKCEKDHSGNGVRVWCWAACPLEVSSQYLMNIEVWPSTTEERKIKNNNKCEGHSEEYNLKGLRTNVVNDVNGCGRGDNLQNISTQIGRENAIAKDKQQIDETSDIEIRDNSNMSGVERAQKDLGQSLEQRCGEDCQSVDAREDAAKDQPLLRFASPVLSLSEVGWRDLIDSSSRALFLSDSLLANESRIIVSLQRIGNW